MKKIILVVGLPGSGKSYYMNTLKDFFIVDDIVNISQLKPHARMAISDVNFCDDNILQKAISILKDMLPDHTISIEYFDNDWQQSIKNVNDRNDGRNVLGTINRFKTIYNPPYISHNTYKGKNYDICCNSRHTRPQ